MMLPLVIWSTQPGDYFCISSGVREGNRLSSWKDKFFTRDQFGEVAKYVRANRERELYFCPHGFNQPRRKKEFAAPLRILYSDLDSVDPRPLDDLMPTYAWETSPNRFAAAWLTTESVSPTLNQRLTQYLGADPGGWDVTQVLRIPDTYNHKYSELPKVRELWRDGPTYKRREVEAIVRGESAAAGGDAKEVFKKWEKKLKLSTRRDLFTKTKVGVGKRSEVIWRLNNELFEAGVPSEERFILLKASPWNKFVGRDKQLRTEVERVIDKHTMPKKASGGFELKSLAEIEEEDIDWLIPNWLARGFVTILEGDPGLGKSYLALMIAKMVIDGEKFRGKRIKRGKVMYFDLENPAAYVTKRRMMDNGAVNLGDYYPVEEVFTISDEDAVEDMRKAIETVKPALVVFDPLSQYIGKADTYKASETTQAFSTFTEIAKDTGCAVLVVRHLTKNGKTSPLYRGQGSIAFTGGARIVLTCGKVDDTLRATIQIKNNLGPEDRRAMSWSIEALPDTLKHSGRSQFVWGDELDLSAMELLAHKEVEPVDNAGIAKLLEALFDDEDEMTEAQVKRAVEGRGFNMKDVRRHSDSLGYTRRVRGFGSKKITVWLKPSSEER